MKETLFIIISILLLAPGPLLAETPAEHTPRFVESALEFDEPLHIGQTVTYRVVVEHSPKVSLHFPPPPATSRWRELGREIDVVSSEELRQTTASLRYTLLRPGPTKGPPITAQVQDETTGSVELFELPQHPLTVSPLAEQGADLGQPRGARKLWTERSLTFVYAAGSTSLLLIALIAFFALRRRGAMPDEGPTLEPHQVALQALKELRRSSLLKDEQFKEFYLRLSEILRRYLGQRFDFPGVEWTTTEIMARLRTLDEQEFEADVEALDRWLRDADRVKFAGFTPTAQAADDHLNQAKAFVKATIPRPTPEESEDGEDPQKQTPEAPDEP